VVRSIKPANKNGTGSDTAKDKAGVSTDTATTKVRKTTATTVRLRAYSDHKQPALEEQYIVEFLPLVRSIAQRTVTYLRPPLSFEDLISAGTIGLVKAAKSYDRSHQAEFKTYAYIRIKGAIIDELRGWSFVPSNANKKVNDAAKLSREITEQTGVAPSDNELAEKLGITLEQLYKTFEDARARHFLSIDGVGDEPPVLGKLLAAANAVRPDEQVERIELIDKLSEAIQQLPERLRQIILLYYRQHLTMKQIAEVLEITESRVSQLHAAAIFNLSAKLRQWKDAK